MHDVASCRNSPFATNHAETDQGITDTSPAFIDHLLLQLTTLADLECEARNPARARRDAQASLADIHPSVGLHDVSRRELIRKPGRRFGRFTEAQGRKDRD